MKLIPTWAPTGSPLTCATDEHQPQRRPPGTTSRSPGWVGGRRAHRAAAIADHFVVALPTVRTQIHSVLAKLEVTSQLAAVALLFDTGSDAPVMPALGRPDDRGTDVVPR